MLCHTAAFRKVPSSSHLFIPQLLKPVTPRAAGISQHIAWGEGAWDAL